MPLDLHAENLPQSSHAEDTSLRVSLIGNKDLKYKLIKDFSFIDRFIDGVAAHVSSVVSTPPSQLSPQAIQTLETKLVVCHILLSFVHELSFKQQLEVGNSISKFQSVARLLVQLFGYYTSSVVPNAKNVPQFESSLSYALDVFIAVTNSSEISFDVAKVWRLAIISVVVSDNAPQSDTSLIPTSVLLKVLRLIPILISSSSSQDTNSYMVTLLLALLKRLGSECSSICRAHFPVLPWETSSISDDEFYEMSFKNANLPNIDPLDSFFNSMNLSLLIHLIIATAQIFSVLRLHDYNVVMIVPQQDAEAPDPKTSPVVIISVQVYLSLLLTLKYDNRLLNMASLNLIHLYLNNLLEVSNSKDLRNEVLMNYRKLFPRIIELLNLNTSPHNFQNNHIQLPKFLESPAKILCTLCVNTRFAKDEIRRCNIDYKIMNTLSNLVKMDSSLENMNLLKKNSSNGTSLVDFTSLIDLERHQRDVNFNISKAAKISNNKSIKLKKIDQLNTLGDYFLLLSIYVGEKEEYRYRLVEYAPENGPKNVLAQLTFEVVDNYRFLLVQLQLLYGVLYRGNSLVREEDLVWFGKNLGIVFSLLGHDFYHSIFHLIRSLSRSVPTLRTFFVECNSFASILDLSPDTEEDVNTTSIVDGDSSVHTQTTVRTNRETGMPMNGSFITNILHILTINEVADKVIKFLCNESFMTINHKRFLKSINPLNKSVILGTIANFVLDFSSFRYDVVNDDYFLKNLSKIYLNATKEEKSAVEYTDVVNACNIQLNVLQILKNYLYNENQENKKELLDFVPISIVFDKAVYGLNGRSTEDEKLGALKLKQKILAFDILRNLTAGSLYFSEQLTSFYAQYYETRKENPKTWNEFVLNSILRFDLFVPYTGGSSLAERLEAFRSDDEFLARLMMDESYVRFMTSLNYIEDHRFTNITTFKKNNFPLHEKLIIWKRLLTLKVGSKLEKKVTKNDLNLKIELNNNLNEVRMSIVWILINLTLKNDDFNYPFSESSNFRLYDIIRDEDHGRPRPSERSNERRGSASASNYRIVIEDSDEDETPEDYQPGEDVLSPVQRASIVYEFGFNEALDRLYIDLTSSMKDEMKSKSKSSHNLKRFDELNSHALLEKVKTANYQIVSLVNGSNFHGTIEDDFQRRRRRSSNIITSSGRSGLSRLPIIYSGTVSRNDEHVIEEEDEQAPADSPRQDVNRGGEGFGYGSDDEYLDPEEGADSGASSSSSQADLQYESDGSELAPYASSDDYWVF